MADTTISVSAFQTACAEVADAIAAEDWALATRWYARAEAINAALELEAADTGHSYKRRENLKSLNDAIKAAQLATNSGSDDGRIIVARFRGVR